MNPWSVNRILQLCEELQPSNITGNSNTDIKSSFSLVDKCVILDILDNDFAVSSDTQKFFDFLNFVSFRNEKEG